MFRAEGCDNIIRGGCASTTSSAWSASGYQPRALFFYAHYTRSQKTVKANKRGGIEMVPWWVLMLAFIAGAALGLFMAALLIADERDDRP